MHQRNVLLVVVRLVDDDVTLFTVHEIVETFHAVRETLDESIDKRIQIGRERKNDIALFAQCTGEIVRRTVFGERLREDLPGIGQRLVRRYEPIYVAEGLETGQLHLEFVE